MRTPPLGPLVGRAVMRHARLAQARADVLEHQAEAHVDAAQALHLVARSARRRWCAAAGRARARAAPPSPGSRPCSSWPSVASCLRYAPNARLGLVAEAEQRLDAALSARARRASRRPRRAHRPRAVVAGRAPERTVVAAVAAQVRQRQEHLGRERRAPAERAIAHDARRVHDIAQCIDTDIGQHQRVLVGQRVSVSGALESWTPHGGSGRSVPLGHPFPPASTSQARRPRAAARVQPKRQSVRCVPPWRRQSRNAW